MRVFRSPQIEGVKKENESVKINNNWELKILISHISNNGKETKR